MRNWMSRDAVENNPQDWIVNKELGIARLKDGPPNKFFFLADASDLKRRDFSAKTKGQKNAMEKMKARFVKVTIDGVTEKMPMAEFREFYHKWKDTPKDTPDEKSSV